MMNDLYIKWNTGKMLIHLDNFFPTSQVKLKKMLKVIELDWEHETELKEKLKVYFQNKIPECEALFEEHGKKYLDTRQKLADITRLIEDSKHPNGLPVSKDELEQAKEDLKKYRAAERSLLCSAKRYKREAEQFSKYLDFV